MSTNIRRLFLVTGANRGIDLEGVKQLSVNHPNDLILLKSIKQQLGIDTKTLKTLLNTNYYGVKNMKKRTTPGPAVLEIFQKFEREQQKQK
jgi:hypothetical protein